MVIFDDFLHFLSMLLVGGVVVRIYLVVLIFCMFCLQFTLIDIFILHPSPLRTHPPTAMKCWWWVALYAFIWTMVFMIFLSLATVYTLIDIFIVHPASPAHPPTHLDTSRFALTRMVYHVNVVGGCCCCTHPVTIHSPTNPYPPSHDSRFLR